MYDSLHVEFCKELYEQINHYVMDVIARLYLICLTMHEILYSYNKCDYS